MATETAGQPQTTGPAVTAPARPQDVRPMRADARRNYERLLTEARTAFTEHGTDTSLEDIARRAGVGIGTLYRHFPNRTALMGAVFQGEVDALLAHARRLADAPQPCAALVEWLRAIITHATTYRGLSRALMTASADDSSGMARCSVPMREAGGALLSRAQQAGAVRPDVSISDLMQLTNGIALAVEESPADPQLADRLLTLTLRGLKGRTAEGRFPAPGRRATVTRPRLLRSAPPWRQIGDPAAGGLAQGRGRAELWSTGPAARRMVAPLTGERDVPPGASAVPRAALHPRLPRPAGHARAVGDGDLYALIGQRLQLRGGAVVMARRLVRDQPCDQIRRHGLEHRVGAELGVVGEHHHLPRRLHQRPVDAGGEHVGGGQTSLGGQTAARQEGAGHPQALEGLFGTAADQRVVGAAQGAAGHHDLDAVGMGQRLGDKKGVGDDGEPGNACEPAGQLLRGRSRADDDGLALFDEAGREIGDGRLLRGR